ncbi:MAG TPA: fatty acid desaturase [Actinophytocola sp.]|nr:fatty acid desaturase [Actinophytocola sp.]
MKHLRAEVRPGAFVAKLAGCAGLTAGGVALAVGSSPALWVPGVLLLGAMFAHAAELQHQALHNLGFRRRRANTVAGVALGMPMLVSFAAYRASHLRHHRDLGTPQNREFFDYGDQYGTAAGSPRWAVALGWLLRFSMILHYAQVVRTLGRTLAGRDIPGETARTSRRIRRDHWLMLAAVGALATAAALLDPMLIVRVWLLPLVAVACPVHAAIELPEHFRCDPATTDPFANTRTIRSTRFATWFTNGNNYHVEHHLMPNLPIERLPELHTSVRDRLRHYNPSYVDYFRSLLRGKADR